ncbi:MAG: ATP-dependent DNA helicase RecG [Gammaproteobacteria bacterium]
MPTQKSKKETHAVFGLRGVGPQIAKQLARLNIFSPQDILFHLPARYQDRTQIQLICQTLPEQEAVIEGVIKSISHPLGGKTKLLCEIQDASGRLFLRFFHAPFQANAFQIGTRLRCYSTIRLGPKGLEMVHPEFQVILPEKPAPVDEFLTPIYPATEGLSQYMLRKLTSNALTWMQDVKHIPELIPDALHLTYGLPGLKEALQFVHRPPNKTSIAQLMEASTSGQKKLIFEELLAHRLSLLNVKQNFQAQNAVILQPQETLTQQFLQRLPFALTNAQARVIEEIKQDMEKPNPMLRLVQGDVGSGKTVIAAQAMLQAVENGYQAALMAPTELLAEQHHRVFERWLKPLNVNLVFLSGNVKAAARRAALKAIQEGEASVVIGTHALFQDNVEFKNLALVAVDEQHRFGVHQRALFREKGVKQGCYPHQLVLTATPIPRTLAMSFYADLDVSVIDELPPGRTPIVTTVMAASKREDIIVRINDACQQGRQVYWVCPLIEESEVLNCQAATQTTQLLKTLLPNWQIGLIHGRMSSEEKNLAMTAFQQNQTQVLVATTVIEVGVDVPNASVMVIENAERLGLSQLHQLRGRVGRGSVASYCILLYQYPISAVGKQRLAVMRETTDGFKIAQRDLELRGPGEVLGTKQTGELAFHVADLIRDSEMLTQIHQAADVMLKNYPEMIEPLLQRWLAGGQEYREV